MPNKYIVKVPLELNLEVGGGEAGITEDRAREIAEGFAKLLVNDFAHANVVPQVPHSSLIIPRLSHPEIVDIVSAEGISTSRF